MARLDPWLEAPFHEFCAALSQGRLPGSVILSCSSDLGASSLSRAMAELFLCHSPKEQGPCLHCRACELMDMGAHPDFIRIRATDAGEAKSRGEYDHSLDDPGDDALSDEDGAPRYVRVDSLRTMAHFLSESAVLGHHKVALITDADKMQESAANAVLKTFEEPPEGTLIIMVTRSLEALLPTILSRAFKISVKAPSEAAALEFLHSRLPKADPQDLRLALALKGNAPYGALQLCSESVRKGRSEPPRITLIRACLESLLEAVAHGGSFEQCVTQMKQLPPESGAALLREFVLECLKFKAYVDPMSLPLISGLAPQTLSGLSAERLFSAWNDLKYIAGRPPLLASRAQAALLRAWFSALTEQKNK